MAAPRQPAELVPLCRRGRPSVRDSPKGEGPPGGSADGVKTKVRPEGDERQGVRTRGAGVDGVPETGTKRRGVVTTRDLIGAVWFN